MFKELAQMLEEGDALTINIMAVKDGRLSMTVVPVGEFKQKDLGSGLSLEATPQEFDDELGAHLLGYVNQRKSLKEQLAAQTLVLEEAEKASKVTTAKAISKGATNANKPKPAPALTNSDAASAHGVDKAHEEHGTSGQSGAAPGAPVELF